MMKLHVLSNDETLISYIKSHAVFEEVIKLENLNLNTKYEALLISDMFLPFNELSQLSFPSETKIFYMVHNQMKLSYEKTVKAYCDGKGIYLIPSRSTNEQIVSILNEVIEPKGEITNNVISFFSSVSNVGTTSISLSVANALNKMTNAKIGVLLLNAWDDGGDFFNNKGQYLDEIKSRLTAKLFENDEEFLSNFHEVKKDSFYILAGNRNIKMERLYTIEEIYYLIETAKRVFDIVLIDSGSHFDNANMLQSLRESDIRFLILNQQVKSRRKFNQMYQEVLYPVGYHHEDFMLIINEFESKTHYPTTKEIHAEVNVPMITTVPKSKYGINSELEQKALYNYDDIPFQESINLVARTIASYTNVELLNDSKDKSRKRFFGVM